MGTAEAVLIPTRGRILAVAHADGTTCPPPARAVQRRIDRSTSGGLAASCSRVVLRLGTVGGVPWQSGS